MNLVSYFHYRFGNPVDDVIDPAWTSLAQQSIEHHFRWCKSQGLIDPSDWDKLPMPSHWRLEFARLESTMGAQLTINYLEQFRSTLEQLVSKGLIHVCIDSTTTDWIPTYVGDHSRGFELK
jgi:hypothetical protein